VQDIGLACLPWLLSMVSSQECLVAHSFVDLFVCLLTRRQRNRVALDRSLTFVFSNSLFVFSFFSLSFFLPCAKGGDASAYSVDDSLRERRVTWPDQSNAGGDLAREVKFNAEDAPWRCSGPSARNSPLLTRRFVSAGI
jgi:hypothetical protein